MNLSKKRSIILSESSPFKANLHRSTPLKKLTKKEFEMDLKIKNLSNEIKQKLAEGKKPEHISIKNKSDINDIISFILDKNALYMNYLLILNHFLYSFNFLEIFFLPENFNNKNDLFNKISLTFKKEEMNSNKIIYINGQLGKKFYIILEGKVTLLEPIEFHVKTTYQKFYEYMEFLLLNNEYELIRLCFSSNKKYVNEKTKFFKDKFYKFNELLDRNLSSDAKLEFLDEKTYIDKFDSFINEKIGEKSILNEAQRKIYKITAEKEEEEEKKEKEKEEKEELEELAEDASRRITGNDAENDRYEILDKINLKKRESILLFNNKRKKKRNMRKDQEILLTLWKYGKKNKVLKTGDSFGENALKKTENKINSTVITKTDCLFCILERDEYRNLISEFVDHARKINVDSLMHSKLFYNYNSDLFSIHYYSYFTPIKKSKGDYLFRQKEERKNIYFIKRGGVQIEYYASWNDLENILYTITEQNIKAKKNNNIGVPYEVFENFIQKKQRFNIFAYFNGEIAGTNEILYPNTDLFMFDAVCISECEIFSLDIESLNNIINEKIIRKNYNELNLLKKEKLIQRLLNLKSNIKFQFNRLMNSETKQQISEKTMKQNNSILIDKSRNTLPFKTNFIISSTDIKKEIINYSPERKSKNRDIPLYKLKNPEPLTFRDSTKYNKFNIFKSKDKKIKILEVRNNSTEYLKTERMDKIRNQKNKKLIQFSLKGKVPKLLINKVNTVNKVLDHLILKEKDLFNNSIYSKANTKNFINHLDILSFDNYVNRLETHLNTNREENSKGRPKKINKLILTPVSLKRTKNGLFTSKRKISFRKDIIV